MYQLKRNVSAVVGLRNGAGIAYRLQGSTTNVVRDTNVKIEFNITKDTSKEENHASITIYNVTPDSFNSMNDAEDLQVVLDAGYLDNSDTIFFGDVRDIYFTKEGTTSRVEIDAYEGLYAARKGVLRKSYAPDTTLRTVINDCKDLLSSLGISTERVFKNLEKMARKEKLLNKSIKNGLTVHDTAISILYRLVRQYNYNVHVNNNALIIAPDDAPIEDQGVLLSKSTGLIGSPQITYDKTVKASALINPLVTVGSRIELRSNTVNGVFTVRTIRYTGDNFDGPFRMDFEAI